MIECIANFARGLDLSAVCARVHVCVRVLAGTWQGGAERLLFIIVGGVV